MGHNFKTIGINLAYNKTLFAKNNKAFFIG